MGKPRRGRLTQHYVDHEGPARITAPSHGTYPGSEYTADEVEFLRAVDRYKREKGRRFPTVIEILRLAQAMGYRKAVGDGPSGD